MRVCRFIEKGVAAFAVLTSDETLLPLDDAARAVGTDAIAADSLLDLLPGGRLRTAVVALQNALSGAVIERLSRPVADVRLLTPVPNPGKLLLLAGNYARHVQERGGRAEERKNTFPYVFMKPFTTLTHPGDPIRIPESSPDEIDWEIELGVIIGRTCRNVRAAEARVCGRLYGRQRHLGPRLRPNPGRIDRPKDSFFDWQHGKWHDTFCPIGPCVLPADECHDPQNLGLTLSVNGQIEQDGTTADMIFPVADVIAFLSSFVTLLPGDILSTGTPAGVGKAKGRFLRAGDVVEARIQEIGVLRNPVA